MEMSLDALESAALNFANELRAADGLGPVAALSPGVRHSCAGDPVAVTAGAAADGKGGWEIGIAGAVYLGPKGATRRTVPVPELVKGFSAAFDAGEFPGLVHRSARVAA